MTGYGKAESATQNKKISVEIRSLNSKQLDLSIKLPAIYRPFEYEIRNKIAQTVKRGKVDVYINTETTVDEGSVKINGELFKIHYNALKAICADNNISSSAEIDATLIQSVMRLPDVVATDSNDISEDEQKALMEAVTAATAQHDAFRTQEGAILIADLLHRVDKIETLKEAVTPFEKARVEAIRTKIHEAIEQLKVEESLPVLALVHYGGVLQDVFQQTADGQVVAAVLVPQDVASAQSRLRQMVDILLLPQAQVLECRHTVAQQLYVCKAHLGVWEGVIPHLQSPLSWSSWR